MITRRSFLAALSCLPFVGKYAKPYMEVSFDFDEEAVWQSMDPALKARCIENFQRTAKLWAEAEDQRIADMLYMSGDQWPEHVRKERQSRISL